MTKPRLDGRFERPPAPRFSPRIIPPEVLDEWYFALQPLRWLEKIWSRPPLPVGVPQLLPELYVNPRAHNSAVLQDPSVAASPIDKRKAFLQSKNLTDEEIELALARAGEDQPNLAAPAQYSPPNYPYPQQNLRQPPPQAYGYGPYQGGPWAQPPEPPRRDWRDWFIMATVTTGLSYGLYTVAKRYVLPLIAPPTPPQLEQDKSVIDASFSRAFALIDQLATDTSALKSAEAERNEKLDSALQEVESVISELKEANKRREDDSRRIGDEVRGLKELIPKALDGWKAEEDVKLKELSSGLKSLKILVGNRVGDPSTTNAPGRPYSFAQTVGTSGSNTPRDSTSQSLYNGTSYTANASEKPEDPTSTPASAATPAPAPGVNVPKRESSSTSIFTFDRPGGRAAIPAWQMAAAGSSKGKSSTSTNTIAPAKTGGEGSAEGSGDPVHE
ncbi:peroxisomal membrane protein pex14 [Trapelia coarctata]|nr:peroxisomal membrane protein pex14 [Trapelia coarctata]